MTVKFEDYEAMERYKAEENDAMKRIDEAKRRRARMESRQQKIRPQTFYLPPKFDL